MKPVSILFLSMVVVIAAVCSAEIDDPSHAKAVPMKLEDIKIQQTFNKFGPKFGLTPILKKSGGTSAIMCCECPQGSCECCPIFGGH